MEKIKSVSLRYGIFTAIGYILYFLIVMLLNMHENPWLRLFNGVIMYMGIYYAIRSSQKTVDGKMTYYDGFRAGLFAGFFSTIFFALFMAVYMYYIDTEFVKNVMNTWFEDYNQGPAVLLFLLFVEGLASSMILTLTIMQKEKRSQNLSSSKKIHHQNA